MLQKYSDLDPNFKHEAAPKPRLTEQGYPPDYLLKKIGDKTRFGWSVKKLFVTIEEEPLFVTADILRFGRDLVSQYGFTTNLKGI